MPNAVDIDDRTLAHLRIVVMNKLRRSESFMFDVEVGDGSGRRSYWMHPAVPIQFHFFGSRTPRINRAWVEELMLVASGPRSEEHTSELQSLMSHSSAVYCLKQNKTKTQL